MKKRLVKKWIKRYITPHIKDLPATDTFATNIYNFNNVPETVTVCRSQHVIVNGFKKDEGEKTRVNSEMRTSIIMTGKLVEGIVSHYQHVLVRCEPIVRGKHIYTRLITE